jgi:uncharacterized membrane protein
VSFSKGEIDISADTVGRECLLYTTFATVENGISDFYFLLWRTKFGGVLAFTNIILII